MGIKKRGRPSLKDGEVSTSVNVRLPATEYDRVYARARAARVSVPEVLRGSERRADEWRFVADARISAIESILAERTAAEQSTYEDDEMDMAASFALLLRKKALELGLYAA